MQNEGGAKKTTLFLGAGFSSLAGLPTMAQFARAFRKFYFSSQDAEDPPWLNRLTIEEKVAVVSAAYHAEFILGALPDLCLNIEWIVSHLDMLRTTHATVYEMPELFRGIEWPAQRGPLFANQCFDLIVSALEKVYRDPLVTLDSESIPARFMRIFGDCTLSIVTVNYDRVAEVALAAIGLKWHHAACVGPREDIAISKLHGDSQGLHVCGIDPESRSTPQCDLNAPRHMGIILPTWIREAPTPQVRHIWNKGTQAIAGCDELVIAGFGMPTTDQHIAHLLTSSLVSTFAHDATANTVRTANTIKIINPDRDAISRTLLAIPRHLWPGVKAFPMTINEYVERESEQ